MRKGFASGSILFRSAGSGFRLRQRVSLSPWSPRHRPAPQPRRGGKGVFAQRLVRRRHALVHFLCEGRRPTQTGIFAKRERCRRSNASPVTADSADRPLPPDLPDWSRLPRGSPSRREIRRPLAERRLRPREIAPADSDIRQSFERKCDTPLIPLLPKSHQALAVEHLCLSVVLLTKGDDG